MTPPGGELFGSIQQRPAVDLALNEEVTQIQRFLANIARFPELPAEVTLLSPRPIYHREANDSAYLGAIPIM